MEILQVIPNLLKGVKFSELLIPDIRNSSNLSKKKLKEKEGRLILDSLNIVIMLCY